MTQDIFATIVALSGAIFIGFISVIVLINYVDKPKENQHTNNEIEHFVEIDS